MKLIIMGNPKTPLKRSLRELPFVDDFEWCPPAPQTQAVLADANHYFDILMEKYKFDGVVAGSESTLINAALCRRRFDLPGPGVDAAIAATNKWVMRRRVGEAFRMPRFWLSTDPQGMRDGELISKPFDESAARGVRLLDGPETVSNEVDVGGARIIEERLPVHAEYHVDGVFQEGRVLWSVASQYDRPVFEALSGARTSMLLQSGVLSDELCAATARVVSTIGQESGVFHMEFLGGPDGLSFGEYGLRPGGGGIATMLAILLGADLWGAHVSSQVGLNVDMFGPQRVASARAGMMMARRAYGHGVPLPPNTAKYLPGAVGIEAGNMALSEYPSDSCKFAYSLIVEGLATDTWEQYVAQLSGARA